MPFACDLVAGRSAPRICRRCLRSRRGASPAATRPGASARPRIASSSASRAATSCTPRSWATSRSRTAGRRSRAAASTSWTSASRCRPIPATSGTSSRDQHGAGAASTRACPGDPPAGGRGQPLLDRVRGAQRGIGARHREGSFRVVGDLELSDGRHGFLVFEDGERARRPARCSYLPLRPRSPLGARPSLRKLRAGLAASVRAPTVDCARATTWGGA